MEYKCSFCGRKVNPTLHSKSIEQGYKVDYYLVWTGKLSPMLMKDPKDEKKVIQYFKLDKPHPLVACAECYEKPEVKKELEKAFKEVPEVSVFEEGSEE